MLIVTKDGSIDQHWKVCMSIQYFSEASMLVYLQIMNLLVYHGIDLKPGVGRILHKDSSTHCLVLAEFYTKTVPSIAWCWQNFTQRQFHPLPGVGKFFCFGAGACSANSQSVMTGHIITKLYYTIMRV